MDTKDKVIECINRVIEEMELDAVEVTESTPLTREYGIDSMGLVSLVIELEDTFDIELDDYLADIRKSATVSELVGVIQGVLGE